MIVVHVITRFIRGGADENTMLTCNGQAMIGHDVHLVVGAETHSTMIGKLDPRVTLHVLDSLVRSISPMKDFLAFCACVRLFRKIRPEIVHTHESKAGVIGRWAAFCAGVPVVVHGVHILAFVGGPRLTVYLFKFLERVTAPLTHAFVDVSEGMKSECLAAGLGRAEEHFVVESGMDIERFRNAREPACWTEIIERAQLAEDLQSGPVQFLLIAGALEPRKRIIEFLPVFVKLLEEFPRTVLLICGDGPLMPRLQVQIEKLGLSGRVLPLGHRGDLERYISLADLCVHLAEREGLPRVVVQYVAVGKPVVSSNLPGIERLVSVGTNGYIVSAFDERAIVSSVSRILAQPKLRAVMTSACEAVDLSAWDANHMVRRIEDIYSGLLKARNVEGR